MMRRIARASACWCFAVVGYLAGAATEAKAQDGPRAAVELTAGWVGFADDGVVSETMVGGAGRAYVHPRIAIGPEIIYIQGDSHSHIVVTGNVTFDLLLDTGRRRLTPFIVVGGGLFQTNETFFGDTITSREGAFTAGGGLRANVHERVAVGVDARVGWEPHVRLGGFVGIRLGR